MLSLVPDPTARDEGETPDGAPPSRARLLLLCLVLAGSVAMAAHHLPGALYFLSAGDPAACGDDVPAWCRLEGKVAGYDVLVAGETPEPGADLRARSAGRELYVRLEGGRTFAVLAADREDVLAWRERHAGALPGFTVAGAGRLFDPRGEPDFEGVAAMLRQRHGVAAGEPIRLFDTTDPPRSRWPQALAVGLMAVNAALALVGLARALRRRRGASPATDVNSPGVSV